MRRPTPKPTIRILLLGAPGVGKNCLESRFTTSTYPPLYNPALTLNSRRYFTLSPRVSTPPEPSARPLDTSHGAPNLRQTSFEGGFLVVGKEEEREGDRPRTQSSTFSNPASHQQRTDGNTEAAVPREGVTETAAPMSDGTMCADSGAVAVADNDQVQRRPCAECEREARTYLVELTNYPDLQNGRIRAAVLAGGKYDAVLLVYDVGSRASFEAVPGLAGQIPLYGRGGRGMMKRASVEGLGGVVGSDADGGWGRGKGRTKLRRRRSMAVGMQRAGANRAGSSVSFRRGDRHRGPVIALVGNKSDVDAEYAGVESGAEDKRAALEEVDVEERGLVHPLYRESQVYRDDLDAGGDVGIAIGLPELRSLIAKPRAAATAKRNAVGGSVRPLLSPYSGRSFVSDGLSQEAVRYGRGEEGGNEWPSTGRMANRGGEEELINDVMTKFGPIAPASRVQSKHTNLDAVIRRSAVSADYHLLSANRTSILSKRSVRTMQEGSKPLVLAKLRKSEAVENWIRTGSPTTAEHVLEEGNGDDAVSDTGGDGAEGRGRSYSNTTTAALSRRQVSKVEGEMLARTLMADVSFYETSAKTGENVEEMFEAVVREVLQRRGLMDVSQELMYAECTRRHEKGRRRREGDPNVVLDTEATVGPAVVRRAESLGLGHEQLVINRVTEADASYTDFSDTQRAGQRRRRGNMLDRFRQVFTRRSAIIAGDTAA